MPQGNPCNANVPLRYLEFPAILDQLHNWAEIVVSRLKDVKKVGWAVGAVVSLLIAASLTFLVRGTSTSVLIPLVFPLFIIPCARYFGLIAGILGSLLATSVFALFLFEPYGSFQVHNHQALSDLALMLFAGIALAYANSGHGDDQTHPRGAKL